MLLKQIQVGNMENFSYLIGDKEIGEAAVIDPGWEIDKLIKTSEENNVKIKYILNTHCHYDHVDGNNLLKEKTGALIIIHKAEANYLKHFSPPEPDMSIQDGEIINIGNIQIKFIHTPGHSPGSVCILADNCLFTGDTLFVGSIGRTDFPGGDPEIMYKSLSEKIKVLDKEVRVYPGHNYGQTPFSTIGWELENNQYLACKNLSEFLEIVRPNG